MRRALAAAAIVASAALRAGAAEPPEPVALTGPLAVAQGELTPLDVDTYSLSLDAGDQLFVALFDAKDGAFTDTRLSVTQGGAVIASNDDGGDGFLSRLALQVSAGGSYQIVVTGFRDEDATGAHAEGAAQPAPYTLVVAVATPPLVPTESEPNDAAGSGDPIGAGGGVVRGTLSALDVDRYAIPVAAGSSLAVSLFPIDATTGAPAGGPAARFDTRLGVFAGAAAPFAENDDGGPGFFSNLARAVPGAGTAEIAVTGFRDTGYAGAHAEGPVEYVLVAAPVAGAVARCDVVPPTGLIASDDIQAIFDARGTPASGPSDPRDADGDGQITVLDASQCRLQCTFPRCRPTACGLLGIEPLGVLALLELRRRRRARAARSQEVEG